VTLAKMSHIAIIILMCCFGECNHIIRLRNYARISSHL